MLPGVLDRNDLEGFLIIMGSLMDTFRQNPLGNPLASKPVLQWFPSFGPTKFAFAGAFGHRPARLPNPRPGPARTFAAAGLLIFRARTRTRTHHDRRAAGPCRMGHAIGKHVAGRDGYLASFPVFAAS